jgi:hypothetical protein
MPERYQVTGLLLKTGTVEELIREDVVPGTYPTSRSMPPISSPHVGQSQPSQSRATYLNSHAAECGSGISLGGRELLTVQCNPA